MRLLKPQARLDVPSLQRDEPAGRVLIRENIPNSAVKGLVDFLETHYLTPSLETSKIIEYSKSGSGTKFELYWKVKYQKPESELERPEYQTVAVHTVLDPTGVTIEFPGLNPEDPRANQAADRAADSVEFVATSFLAKSKRTDLYFISSPGEEKVMEAPRKSGEGVLDSFLKRVFAGNSVNLFLLFLPLSFVLAFLLGDYALPAILCLQAVVIFYSDKLVLTTARVKLDKDNPEVLIVRVASTPSMVDGILNTLDSIIRPIELALGEAIPKGAVANAETKGTIYQVLTSSGVKCNPDDIEVTARNPYDLVQTAAEKFHLPPPKVAISNTPMDNAAATGVAPNHATMTITAGALEDLDDDELTAVIGHELGHVKGRDPLILFGVTSFLYLGGYYLWYPLLLYLGFLYFLIALAITYLVGKFLETRADTLSAIVLGIPDSLASALTAIGFTQLYSERYSRGTRLLEWFRFDPHPPIYFRIQRLARISHEGVRIRHAFLTSVRDCLSGFLAAFVPS